MPISAGDKIGPYEILALVGKGGMGEVYRAHDSRLNRDVAIKVSNAQFTERFTREARTIASLNHTNICHLYDVGPNYLVMEYVEGPDLRGPLDFEDALPIIQQVIDGIEAAREKNIIHRDLKPANIKITPEGVVKILDFGLAKAMEPPPSDDGKAENSPTLTIGATVAGTILGTAAYMAPEQAKGRAADKRSDIWSFGVIVYEMLTGKRLFQGDSAVEILGGVLNKDPDISAAPPRAHKLLNWCLEKDRKKRLASISDARRLLVEDRSAPGAAARSRLGKLPWIAAGVLAVVAASSSWITWRATRPPELKPLMRLNVEIAPDTPLARGIAVNGVGGNMLALSPDGTRLAVTLRGADGQVRLHTRLLSQSQVTPLPGTENASGPFFAPAGDWIGFFADGKLKKIAVEGGAAVTLCDARVGFGGSWGDDGNIIAALSNTGVLSRVPSGGGAPVPLTKLNSGEVTHRWPQVLPGSQAVVFTSAVEAGARSYDDANIEVLSLKTGERKTIQRGGFSARYLADATDEAGHLIYLQGKTLFAVPFDPGRLAPIGSAAPILEDVSSSSPGGGDFAFAGAPSGPGSFVYLSGKATQATWSISWVDRSGKTQPLHAPPGEYSTPRFSPDGKRLAFWISNGTGADIWVKDLDRDTPSRLSFLPGQNRDPVWTPDGKNIVFGSTNPAAPGLYGVRSDGSGEAQRLTEGERRESPSSFSVDGKRLAIAQPGNGGSADIFTMPVDVDSGQGALRLGKAELFLGTPFVELDPAFSPDGRWLAYESSESGIDEVYVRPFPGPGGRWQVSPGGGHLPVWTRDGRELLFATPDGHVMAVSYTVTHAAGGDTFAAGKPRMWTETRLRNMGNVYTYDIAPDGTRLAAIVADDAKDEKPLTHLTFLLNFFDELRRRVPTSK